MLHSLSDAQIGAIVLTALLAGGLVGAFVSYMVRVTFAFGDGYRAGRLDIARELEEALYSPEQLRAGGAL